jgi:iron complex transport system substrate-binding protein
MLAGLAAIGVGGFGAAGMSACSSGAGSSTGSPSDSTSVFGTGVEPGALPVTIEHRFGSTTVEKAPQRIVCVGLKEQDDLLALGLKPVGATKWLDLGAGGVLGSWAQAPAEQAGGADITVLNQDDGIQFEQVAALEPDLIIGLYSGLTADDYDKLSRLAPVIAHPEGQVDYGIAWDEQALTVGRAVGRPQQMQRLVDDVKTKITEISDDHPEFAGKSALVATLYEGIYLYGPQDPRSRLIVQLGFELPADLSDLTGTASFGASISTEKIEIIDTDLLIWLVSPATQDFKTLQDNKLYRNLTVAKEGRAMAIPASSPVDNAFNFNTVLSLPFLLDQLPPLLSAAVDGDPTTTPEV